MSKRRGEITPFFLFFMDFFYSENFSENHKIIPQEEMKHIKVKRIKDFELFGILDGKGKIFYVYFENKEIKIKDVRTFPENKEIFIASPLPEGKRLHFLCEKIAEFGSKGFIPLITERSLRKGNIDKIKRYIIEGMKQSGNPYLPVVYNNMKLVDVLNREFKNIYFGDKEGETLKEVKEGLFIAGPEGGLTDYEKKYIISKGGIPVKLSKYTLRIESAVIAFLTIANL